MPDRSVPHDALRASLSSAVSTLNIIASTSKCPLAPAAAARLQVTLVRASALLVLLASTCFLFTRGAILPEDAYISSIQTADMSTSFIHTSSGVHCLGLAEHPDVCPVDLVTSGRLLRHPSASVVPLMPRLPGPAPLASHDLSYYAKSPRYRYPVTQPAKIVVQP